MWTEAPLLSSLLSSDSSLIAALSGENARRCCRGKFSATECLRRYAGKLWLHRSPWGFSENFKKLLAGGKKGDSVAIWSSNLEEEQSSWYSRFPEWCLYLSTEISNNERQECTFERCLPPSAALLQGAPPAQVLPSAALGWLRRGMLRIRRISFPRWAQMDVSKAVALAVSDSLSMERGKWHTSIETKMALYHWELSFWATYSSLCLG